MFPVEVLADNPAILEKVVELSARRICRFCLSVVDSLVEIDVVWKMKIVSCFPMVSVGSGRLPKFICEPCGKFVKKCYEFRQLCKKSEQMLVNYPLTGSWTGELAIPRWLREEDQQEQGEAGKKRKFVEDLEVPKVGSLRVRSHESMSLQSPTITPGLVEQVDEPSRESLIESHPTVIRQLEQPAVTPKTFQSNYAVPVIQSTSQPVSLQHPSSFLPYNTPSSQSRDPVTNITPDSHRPQKIQRTNSIPSLPQLILLPSYTMQQYTPNLVSGPQTQTCNINLNNMVQMVSQLPSFSQTSGQQQFTNVTLLNQIQRTSISTPSATSSITITASNQQQPQIAMTPIRAQNPQMTLNYQQPLIAMTPTRAQNPSTFQNLQQPSIAMTPTAVQNPAATPNYQLPLIAMTPTRSQNPSMTPNYQQPPIAMTPTRPQNSPSTPTHNQSAMTPTRIHPIPTNIWCRECNFRFLSVEHYKFHIRKHNLNPIAELTENLRPQLKTCRLCTAKTFPTHDELRRHLELHERVGLSKACDFCIKIFADEQHRNEHFRKHHAEELERTLKLNEQ